MDYADPVSLRRAMRGIDRVFLLLPFAEPMIHWVGQAVAAARATGASHIVRLSGFGADPESGCLLNRIQGRLDSVVRGSGVPWTVLRPNAFMQNFPAHHGGIIRRDDAFYLPDGDGRTSYVDARDIASVAAEVLLAPELYRNQALDITGPEALSGGDVAEILSTAAGRPISYHPVDEDAARGAMAGMPRWSTEALLSMSAFVRADGAAAVRHTVRDVTGNHPITFERFARDYADAWKR